MNKETSIALLALAANQEKKEKAYWLDQLSAHPVKCSFPFDGKQDGEVPYHLETIDFSLPAGICQQLMDLSKGSDNRLFIVLLTGIFVLLSKYTGSRDMLLGIPVSRHRENTGLINSALAIRGSLQEGGSFRQLLSKIRRTVIEAVENQNFPIEILAGLLGLNRSPGEGFPMFDVVVSLKNIHYDTLNEFSPNIIFSFERTHRGIAGLLNYNTGRYSLAGIQRLATHYRTLLERALPRPDIPVAAIELLSEEEKQEILISFNDTDADFPETTAVHEWVDRRARLTPRAEAVVYQDQRLSYGALKKKTDDAAAILRQKGVAANTIVAVLFDHSPGMVVALLGILKAGGAYLPIDPGIPEARIQYLVKDSGAKYIITADRYLDKNPDRQEKVLPYTQLEDGSSSLEPLTGNGRNHRPHHPAYIMYTSGSTGKPKGVMIEHRSFIDFVTWSVRVFGHCPGYRVLLSNSYASDGSIQQIYPPLVSGGVLHLVDRELRLDIARYLDYLKKNKINNIDEVPVLMNELVGQVESAGQEEGLPDLTCLCLGSEYVPIELVRKCRKYLNRTGKIINAYGPAEASVETTFYYFDGTSDSEISLIGKPRANTRVYILDPDGNCCPIGVEGEICISGVGLAAGYLNQPELTTEKFITGEHRSYISQRLYHTGDQGCWQPDGNIRFCGRIDNQIQVRGYRVELSGIQQVLKDHEKIRDAVVATQENKKGETEICAYYVGQITGKEVRRYLEDRLPSYMLPAYLQELEKIPLTPNGKVDKKALPAPTVKVGERIIPPGNEVEKKLVEIWAEILGIDKNQISIEANFFELGGHSLNATIMVSRVHKELNVNLKLGAVFKTPTIAELAPHIKASRESIHISIKPVEEKEYYPLSSAQKRMFVLNRIKGDETSDNTPNVFIMEGPVNREHFEAAARLLIKRHESLRTSFELLDEKPVQRVYRDVEFEIEYEEPGSGEQKIPTPGQLKIIHRFIRPFNLAAAPLFRVGLVKLSREKHILMYDMHHIINDDFSQEFFIKEFINIYEGVSLPPLKIRCKDFSIWQNNLVRSGAVKKQEEYWLEVFKGEIPVLNFPTDFPRPAIQTFEGESLNWRFDKIITGTIDSIAKETGATLYMVLLAIYNILLSKYSGQEEIIVGTPTVGRPHTDLQHVVGMFANTVAMRNYPRGEKSFLEFIEEVKRNSVNAFENQDYQFEELIQKLGIKPDPGRQPLFETMLTTVQAANVSINLENPVPGIKDSIFKPYDFGENVTQFDIIIHASKQQETIHFYTRFSTKLFKKRTLEKLFENYEKIVRCLAVNRHIKLREIKIAQTFSDASSSIMAEAKSDFAF